MALETFPYDPAEFLKDDETISAYLTVSLEEDDSSYFVRALGAVARARNRMEALAQELGMPIEALDKLLRDGKKVDVNLVLTIVRSLRIELRAHLAVDTAREHASVA